MPESSVTCRDCGASVDLVERVEKDDAGYYLTCDCEMREVEVTGVVSQVPLLDPPMGKWTSIDMGSEIG